MDWEKFFTALFTGFFGALVVALPNLLAVWHKFKQHSVDLAENTRLTTEIHEATVPEISARPGAPVNNTINVSPNDRPPLKAPKGSQ